MSAAASSYGSSGGGTNTSPSPSLAEVSHYVVTAHPPGCVLSTAKCNFVSPNSVDVLVAKSGRLEVRQLRVGASDSTNNLAAATADAENTTGAGDLLANPFPLLFQVPMYGRITNMVPFSLYNSSTSLVFFLTDRHQYGVIGYANNSGTSGAGGNLYPVATHASGSVTAASLWAQATSAASGPNAAGSGVNGDGTPASGGSGNNTSSTSTTPGAAWTNDNSLAVLGQEAEAGPTVLIDPLGRCIVMHLHTGLLAVIPIHRKYNPNELASQYKSGGDGAFTTTPPRRSSAVSQQCLGQLFHVRIEERMVLTMTFLEFSTTNNEEVMPHLCILHQDARGVQHVTTHVLNVQKRQMYFCQSTTVPQGNSVEWLRKTAVDGGSAMLLSVPPPGAPSAAAATTTTTTPAANTSSSSSAAHSGGVIVVGQRQFTFCSSTTTKIIPVPQALYLSSVSLPADPNNGMPRFLLSDEFGNLHLLTLLLTTPSATAATALVLGMQLETLGSCNLSRDLSYLGHGLVYVASHLGDSQLIQIHDEPIPVHEGVANSSGGRASDDTADSNNNNNDTEAEMDILADTTYIQVLEEYTNLGPILDFDLIPSAPPSNATATNAGADMNANVVAGETSQGKAASTSITTTTSQVQQSQVVTCSGSSKMGSLRVIRNGIGMNEYANVEIPGISNMWSLRQVFSDVNDTYLVQSFVGETRVLGVTMARGDDENEAMADGGEEEDEPYGSLEEVVLPGLESNSSTLYVGNLQNDSILQITEMEIRLIGPLAEGGPLLNSWSAGPITVAAANEAGQIALAQQGGNVLYFKVENGSITKIAEQKMEREVSCLNLNAFRKRPTEDAMDVDSEETSSAPVSSKWLAVGLWDDFTVRLLDLENTELEQAQKILLSSQPESGDDDGTEAPVRRNRNNMMARSLCLITLDFSSHSNNSNANSGQANNNVSSSPGVDMLFVGLGDGSLISFSVVSREGQVSVRSKKEVCLGTQRIDLVPLSTRGGGSGSCVLATGDRPTVIYLAGLGGGASSSTQFNPKLCYSSVNLSSSEDDEMDDTVARPPSHQSIAVNVASAFYSPLLFDTAAGSGASTAQQYSLCIADETSLRLGVIDDIQKLHVTTCRLGMAPRRIVHCVEGRLFAVGCMESGIKHLGTAEVSNSMGNCIRFMDDTSFDDIKRVDMDPFETILSMAYVSLVVPSREVGGVDQVAPEGEASAASQKTFLVVGTGYSHADESEITRGRVLLFSCEADESAATGGRSVRQVTELSTNGGVFSICQFFEATMLCTVNSKTMLCRLHDDAGVTKLQFIGVGHHGHILSMFVKSRAQTQRTDVMTDPKTSMVGANSADAKKRKKETGEMLAVVGDLMRSVSVVQYFPDHQILEEIARDFNANWTTALEMLTDDIYLAGEHWCNLYCLRRNKAASAEEVRGRLDVVGEYHLAEMCNKFMSGSLVMPVSTNNQQQSRRISATATKKGSESPSKGSSNAALIRRPVVKMGSQTLFGTVDGTLGVILGMDGRTAAFFSTLERAMAKTIRPVGDLSHQLFRAYHGERRIHPAHGFVDGDLVERFLDLDRNTMEAVVKEMNRDGGWEVDDAVAVRSSGGSDDSTVLVVEDVVAMVEEISMMH